MNFKLTLIILITFCLQTSFGQTSNIIGIKCFDKDLHKIQKADTLIFTEVNPLLYKVYKFSGKGNFYVCNRMKPVNKNNGRTMKYLWDKLGTWTYKLNVLIIKTDSLTITLQLIPSSKDNFKFIVQNVQTK